MNKFLLLLLKCFSLSIFIIVGFFLLISFSTIFTDKIESSIFQFGTLNGKLNQRSKMFKEWLDTNSENKILFLGSSTMYRNFNPKFLSQNYDGFNIGSPGMNIKIGEEIIASFVNSKINVFILEISPILWNLNRYETRKNWIQDWDNPTDKVIRKITFNSRRTKEYLIYLYAFIKFYFPSKYYPLNSPNNSKLSSKGTDCITDKKKFTPFYQDYNLVLSPENTNALIRLSNMFLKNEEKKILFVINSNRDLNYTTDELPVHVINFNDYFEIEKKFFRDEVHLNCEGSKIFSEQASKIIENILENK